MAQTQVTPLCTRNRRERLSCALIFTRKKHQTRQHKHTYLSKRLQMTRIVILTTESLAMRSLPEVSLTLQTVFILIEKSCEGMGKKRKRRVEHVVWNGLDGSGNQPPACSPKGKGHLSPSRRKLQLWRESQKCLTNIQLCCFCVACLFGSAGLPECRSVRQREW